MASALLLCAALATGLCGADFTHFSVLPALCGGSNFALEKLK